MIENYRREGITWKRNVSSFTPIGTDGTDIRRAADGVIDAVISPVLESQNFIVEVAHRITTPGSINRQVISRIFEADLVVANLTDLNANVMYELAIRHAVRKPVIIICDKERTPRLPFDVAEERTIFYTNDMQGVVELQVSFSNMVEAAINDQKPDNPIYRSLQVEKLLQDTNEAKGFEEYIIDKFEKLEEKLGSITISQRLSNNIDHEIDYSSHKFKVYAEAKRDIDDFGDIIDVFRKLDHVEYRMSTTSVLPIREGQQFKLDIWFSQALTHYDVSAAIHGNELFKLNEIRRNRPVKMGSISTSS